MAELLKKSINSDGTPYNNGKGYKSGYRLNSSGVETAQSGVAVTGFMPVKIGDKITFSNLTIPAGNGISGCAYCYIAFYDSSFSLINSYYGYTWYSSFSLSIYPYETVEYSGKAGNYILKSITVNINNSNVAYMRISALDMSDSSSITNEEPESDAIVIARADVTLSSIVDVKSTCRYYKLQSSTLSTPSKPTTNPPSGWTTTEPSYTAGSTNSLYFVDLTVFCDDTFSYSDVSLSSSYEAAKAAYNKAVAADDTAQDAKDATDKNKTELISMGEQLVINGNGMMGDNTNFSSLVFDASKANGSFGSFTRTDTTYKVAYSDQFFPITPTLRYSLELDAMSTNAAASMYSFLNMYDADEMIISSFNHMYITNTLTTLASELKNGDTVVHLTDMSNWQTTNSQKYTRGFIFWNYKNSYGYQYPENTYSRNAWYDLYVDSGINVSAKTITLTSAWTHGTIPAGTKVSQSNSGGSFKYEALDNKKPPTKWTHYSGYYDGVDYSGQNVKSKFPPGAAFAKVGFLWNYNSADDQVWVTNISVKTDYQSGIDNAQNTADDAIDKANANQTNIAQTRAELQILSNSIATLVTDSNGSSLMTQTPDGWTFNIGSIKSNLDDVSQGLNDVQGDIASVDSVLDRLESLTNDITEKTAYITMTQDDNGLPCIELGKEDSDFKVRITNESIDFVQGSQKIAYITHHTLYIQSSVVTDEMQIGESPGWTWKKRANNNLGLRYKV